MIAIRREMDVRKSHHMWVSPGKMLARVLLEDIMARILTVCMVNT
jgi:hypothetical protein